MQLDDGSPAVWLVEHAPDPESTDQTQLWYAHLYVHAHFGLAGNAWALFYLSDRDPIHAVNVAVTTMPGPTPDTSLLLVGRRRDDGRFAYDVIAGVPGDLPVVAGGGLNMVQGSVVIQGSELADYNGICPDQSAKLSAVVVHEAGAPLQPGGSEAPRPGLVGRHRPSPTERSAVTMRATTSTEPRTLISRRRAARPGLPRVRRGIVGPADVGAQVVVRTVRSITQ